MEIIKKLKKKSKLFDNYLNLFNNIKIKKYYSYLRVIYNLACR